MRSPAILRRLARLSRAVWPRRDASARKPALLRRPAWLSRAVWLRRDASARKPALLRRPAWFNRLPAPLRELGLYAVIALIIPGGSLIALGAWALRHRESAQSRAATR